jgi:para-nitrobenzyl esterase
MRMHGVSTPHLIGAAPTRRRAIIGLGASALTASTSVAHTRDLVVRLQQGAVSGFKDAGVIAFLGIRYAAAGPARRFQPPTPPPHHEGVLAADTFGPASPQRRAPGPADEDCLVLNIWTPDLSRASRPVLVYIHGGGHVSGSGADPLTHGAALAAHGDCVVVTLNHRLNAFGHLYLQDLFGPAYAASGNVALCDLIAALHWIKGEISKFGGDPQTLTVFGQSGGGAKIATLMAIPAARGLLHRAWTMSGQQVTAQGPRAATTRARIILDHLKIRPGDDAALRACATDVLLDALELKDPTSGGALYFGPVLDETVLPRHPFYPDAPAQSAHLPMVMGNTSHETASLIAANDPSVWTLTWETLRDKLATAMVSDLRVQTVIDRYRTLYPRAAPSEIFIRATTAGRSWRGQIIQAEARARQGAPTYVYQLDWASPRRGGAWGAPHTIDIPLVFLNTGRAGDLTGDDTRARVVSRTMADALLRFARTGSPSGLGALHWPHYDLRRRTTMIFDDEIGCIDDPRSAERRLFAATPYIQPGTL